MSEITANLNTALEIIQAAISNCSQFETDVVPSNGDSPFGRSGNQYWGIPNDDNTPGNQYWGIPNSDNTPTVDSTSMVEDPLPAVYPVSSTAISIEGNASAFKFVDVGGGGGYELIELSDGSFQLVVTAGPSAAIGIPGTNFGVEANAVGSVTYDLSIEQAQSILNDPKNLADFPKTLTESISAISFEGELSVGLDGLGVEVPEHIQNQLENHNLEFPDQVDGSYSNGYELSKDANGNWEVSANIEVTGVSIEKEDTTDGWRKWANRASPYNVEDVNIEGTSNGYKVETTYNTGTGEIYNSVTEVNSTFQGEGKGIDIDLIPATEIDLNAGEYINGNVETETIETKYDLSGNEISRETTNSSGTTHDVSVDVVVANGGGNVTQTEFDIPVSDS